MSLSSVSASLLVLLTSLGAVAAPATDLTTDYLPSPMGIDSKRPGFAWRMKDARRGAAQSAYQVQVASSPKLLNSGKPDMWDSGKVSGSQSIAVAYAGKPLASRTTYYWRVRAWDEKGIAGDYSAPASFEMGLLKGSEWAARWITGPLAGGNGYHSEFGESVGDTKWVQIDLGKTAHFSAIALYPARPYNWQRDEPGFGFPVRYRIEVSDDANFGSSRVVADRTASDQPNPGADPVKIPVKDATGRYVRVTTTTLDSPQGTKPALALAEMEVLDAQGHNIALNANVTARDSIEHSDWSTRLLTDGRRVSSAPQAVSPLMRREFQLTKQIKRARAYVTGLGYCELRINGHKVGDRVLDPPRTEFTKRVCYSTYDIKPLLVQGANCAGVMLGQGWWRGALRARVQLMIDFADGSSKTVVSDGSWKWSNGPILENSLYNGETYDARLDKSGWDKPGYADGDWKSVDTIDDQSVVMSAADIQPIKVLESFRPRAITSPKPGIYVVDFGQNFSGWCKLSMSAPAGTKVTLRHAELLYPDGTVNQENLRSARATDVYTAKGAASETYEPRFTYHGFRYVQIEGYPGQLKPDAIVGRVVATAMEPRGTFACSSKLISQIQHNCWWGERTNFHSIPTDCPQRDERQGWMGDAWMSADAIYRNFNVAPAYAKFLRDIADAQGPNGEVPDTVPHVWGGAAGDPMWSAAYPMILWETYLHTGDKQILAEHYDGVKRFIDWMAREANDYILSRNTYGDWIAVVGTPQDLISAGTFHWLTGKFVDMADVLGKADDAAKYRELRGHIADAFNARYFDAAKGSYGNGSQFSNAFPLYLGIVPEGKRDQVLKSLVDDITINHKDHLSTGFIGTPFLIDTLVQQGRADLAYKIISQDTYPGWGYMVKNGATTVWELWELKTGNGMNSHNHPALGFVSAWFYQNLAGLQTDLKHPAWARFTVKPDVLGDLKWAKASVETLRGTVKSEWKLTGSGIAMFVVVPANSAATVSIPKLGKEDCEVREGKTKVWANGKFARAEGISGAKDTGERIEFDVKSGAYAFQLTGK